jgi:hypothetical protein
MSDIPRVIQAIPTSDFKVYVYFDDWTIKLYDASEIIKKGIFQPLQDIDKFKKCCTVLNGTLSWDLTGNYDVTKSLDVDPIIIYKTSPTVDEPDDLNAL